ncbi:MAG: carbamoyltransferase HypF, partial [Chloroflexi bacterium]|nr:carbamoyltransferase HypF [Chloroflexota bacterium]
KKLRSRKNRVEKPFAIMMADIETVRQHCLINENEEEILLSIERPIVILDKKLDNILSKIIAPHQKNLGVMLPYTPMHYLLLEKDNKSPEVLVMTSGNISEASIEIENQGARNHLENIADVFLMHDREILTECDDSVIRFVDKKNEKGLYPIRRSRGFAPFPIQAKNQLPQILATGAELKNTFGLTRDRSVFMSPHIGNMDSYETLNIYKKNIDHLEQLFKIQPIVIAHDLHPNYLTTKYAKDRGESEGIPTIEIQHHHAHIAACMAENGLGGDEPVIGVAFDGTGFGSDGAVWGGEFLVADFKNFERVSHLDYVRMAGGEKAIRDPYRLALAWLEKIGLDWEEDLAPVKELLDGGRRNLKSQLQGKVNSPLTSSMGRLFDAVSSLAGLRQKINYEAQGAIELEAIADPDEKGCYEFNIVGKIISPENLIRSVIADWRQGISKNVISARFHNGAAEMVLNNCLIQKKKHHISNVVLSGGVWQNILLLTNTLALLRNEGFNVFTHHQVPTNDGGIALGQAVIAAKMIEEA